MTHGSSSPPFTTDSNSLGSAWGTSIRSSQWRRSGVGFKVFGHIPKKIQAKRKTLHSLFLQDTDGRHGAEINRLRKDLNDLLDSEEIFWNQRSRVQWLKEGDRNTKFFHHRASKRKKKYTILGIKDENGTWCDTNETIAGAAIQYFKDIYTSSQPSCFNDVIGAIPSRVTNEMNEELIKEFTKDEVLTALKQMHPTKAPGPDGMSAVFFQKYWDIVGASVSNMAFNVLNSHISIADINKTNIALVPKKSSPTKMAEFRPISLSNVIYKIIAKVLSNRLKAVLPQIITENQSAFLSERLITDNILVAFEIMHYLNNKREGKESFMAVKLDMSKAFDRVEWGFIEAVMEKLGFHERWIGLIMHCITTVTYSILINGTTYGCISPTRGLRQGDPLSPYLFILCAEGLSSLFNRATRTRELSGISICHGSPQVSHLFFADDSLLFCRASSQECHKLTEILSRYEAASGQKINTDKSFVFFSLNTTQETKNEVLDILGPMQDSRHSKYLGLPSIIGKSKNEVFVELKEKVGRKLSGWKEKMLSMGGKEVLINAVA
ncbi:hypothetical protein SO802_011374 [Lithocarpus litseifolius]|uniref:Reverse transcriptase domain-containing protein n=1 Tax=Lithocarpus litseifolius TaxID=425828 RepID=A0AAW2CZT6_9ROSI